LQFLPLGYIKDKLIDKRYATPGALLSEVAMIISEIPSHLLSRISAISQEKIAKML
jgi:hypothetical protein